MTNINLKDVLIAVPVENHIHGWFDFDDIYRDMVLKAEHDSIFVEVGSWLGKSACYMASLIKASNKNIKFDCIDVWSDFAAENAYVPEINDSILSGVSLLDKFKKNMSNAGVLEYLNAVQGWSWEASSIYKSNSIDFVFLDAAHDYDSVKKDLIALWPKIKYGGHFGGHDYNNSPDGVKKAVDEFFGILNMPIKIIYNSWFVEKI